MIALVTGGAARLGAAIAARLARDGYDLAIHVHQATTIDPMLAAAIAEAGVSAQVFAADLGDEASLTSLWSEVTDHFGTAPTLLVNNASMLTEGGWLEMRRAELMRHLAVNTVAPIMLTQMLAASAREGERSAVVNILDQRITNPPVDQAAYTASKLALASSVRVMARAFAPATRVNAVAPGLTIPGPSFQEAQIERLAGQVPLGLLPHSSHIAEAVAYLAGAQTVTGQILFVDGGASIESHARDFVHMLAE